ncbi:MBL fold metallo-hydrolase [Georgenia sp. Z1491]|uniref:MBL fold metallo-hydrolase n=1 Tax=Georgenia sp. Z1491 TaxID=3416707 RepID=UPI003CF2E830
MSELRIETVVTSGTFTLDGETFDVDNNVYVIGDDASCVIIDAAHDAAPVIAAVAGRKVTAILLTHGHDDHLHAVAALREATAAPTYLHPADRMLWDVTNPDLPPDEQLVDGMELGVGGAGSGSGSSSGAGSAGAGGAGGPDRARVTVIHTPGHSPGSCCFHVPELGVVLTGDTLFQGGPGATGRSYSDFPTIIDSIRDRLLTLPAETRVLTGHGDSTTIGAEAPQLEEWIARGH